MLKSLYSGVSGLQSHQIAMDVESNNIANVNTIGFKYSRANFSDLLAQTNQIATAPQGQLGGKNAVQVGLGATVASITRIHSQGSIQNTDKNTDVAIQGDGFFIVSADDGNSYKYTRSGDFKFDGNGNFVDNNGFIAQGWIRDEATGLVDATAPIVSINIAPGLTTPANATQEVTLKANLNSGNTVQNISPTYTIVNDPTDPTFNSPGIIVDENGDALAVQPAHEDLGVMFNEQGEAFSLQQGQGVWVGFTPATVTSNPVVSPPDPVLPATVTNITVEFTLDDATTVTATYPSPGTSLETDAQTLNGVIQAINQISNQTGVTAASDGALPTAGIVFTNTNNDSNASHNINITASSGIDFGAGPVATAADTTAFTYTYDAISGGNEGVGVNKTFNTIEDLRAALQLQARSHNDDGDGSVESSLTIEISPEGSIVVSNPGGTTPNPAFPLFPGADDYQVALAVTAFTTPSITENIRFSDVMNSLNGTLPAGSTGQLISQSMNAAVHSSSIDIFDSLGSKHTLRMEFRKTDVDAATGTTWSTKLTVPEPATIGTVVPLNEVNGSIRFTNDGALATYSPISVSFSGNNGSAPNQPVRLEFGTANLFDGMTSFDSPSATSGISQDGFTGGDLLGIRIDQSGTLVGSFSNGRSFGLAQISMAKFANNEGMTADGGNVYIQSANSGDPIIGEAATAGRGFIQSSALEASNVDLSRSLTQLIIIQRGYQANGKTITTSDQLLNTLINLKN